MFESKEEKIAKKAEREKRREQRRQAAQERQEERERVKLRNVLGLHEKRQPKPEKESVSE